jgi:hypothetical protein
MYQIKDGWTALRIKETGDVLLSCKVAVAPGHGFTHEVLIRAEHWIELVAEMAGYDDAYDSGLNELRRLHGVE